MLYGKKALTIAAAATGAVLAAGSAPALGSSHARSATISTPHLTITMTGKSGAMQVSGARTFSAGLVNLTLIAKKGEQEFGIARLHKGYTYKQATKDFATFFSSQNPTPAGLKALNRVVRHVTFYGGIDSGTGHKTVRATVNLSHVGTYYLIDDNNGPGAVPPVKLHVTKRQGTRTAPKSDAFVKAVTAKRFRGATTLPARGTITFKNASINSPHFLFLQHVKDGATRKQVRNALFGNGPNVIEQGGVGTDALFMGQSQTLTYKLPAGTYAEMCFFPDLQTGMPHAMMGMIRIVHVK